MINKEELKNIQLSLVDLRKLKSLARLCRADDLLDVDAYDSIERSCMISDAWDALKVIDSLQINKNKDIE